MDELSMFFNIVLILIALTLLLVFHSFLGAVIIRNAVKIFKRVWNSVD